MRITRNKIRKLIKESIMDYKSEIRDLLASDDQSEVNRGVDLLVTMVPVNPNLRSTLEFALDYFQGEVDDLLKGPIDPMYGPVTQDLVDVFASDDSIHGRIEFDRLNYMLRTYDPNSVMPEVKRLTGILRRLESVL